MSTIRIVLVGDHDPAVTAHRAIPIALELAGRRVGVGVEPWWLRTDAVRADPGDQLADVDGLWCVPASPYASMDGALRAIRHARETALPFLGTCGGFQHALIEYARNVLGVADADHAETNPDAALPLITRLACSLVEESGEVRFAPGSRVAEAYGAPRATERYHCNFGVNPAHRELLTRGALRVSGEDDQGEVRAVELEGHPFYCATLFQPERWALRGEAHPLIAAFVRTAADHHDGVRLEARASRPPAP